MFKVTSYMMRSLVETLTLQVLQPYKVKQTLGELLVLVLQFLLMVMLLSQVLLHLVVILILQIK